MKKRVILIVACLMVFLGAGVAYAFEDVVKFGRFGDVTVYRQADTPKHIVLFVSGDGGWNLGVVDMAQELSTMDALVAGVDIRHYLKELESSPDRCSYPAADFEELSKFLQKRYGYQKYALPVLVGYSSGATLVYAAAVQSPPNTFAGAISMGFCPDLPLTKPFCKGMGLAWTAGPKGKGYSFLPAKEMKTRWIAFQGTIDQVCDATAVEAYVKQVVGAKVVILPHVGHGFSVPKNWMPQFRASFAELTTGAETQAPASAEVADLPLVEVVPPDPSGDYLAVIISGDGGWAGIDKEMGEFLSKKGVPVVGFNSLQYFWTKRTPEEASGDLARVLKHYMEAWKKDKAIVIGYSLGADVLPFMADGLPQPLKDKVAALAFLSPSSTVDFEFHVADWLGGSEGKYKVLPAIEKLSGMPKVCFYGEEEKDAPCREIPPAVAKVIKLKGAHHYDGAYDTIIEEIMAAMKAK